MYVIFRGLYIRYFFDPFRNGIPSMSFSGVTIFERSELASNLQSVSIWAGVCQKLCTAGCWICPAIKNVGENRGEMG